ncbi:MAG TPA: hypothetical protein V6C86_00160 [Oculatellaceae cyanobacterium]
MPELKGRRLAAAKRLTPPFPLLGPIAEKDILGNYQIFGTGNGVSFGK